MILRLYSLDKISYISYKRSVLLTPAYTHKAFWTRGVIPSIFTMPPTFQEPPAHAELAEQVPEENSPGLLLRDHDPGWQLNPWGHDAKKFQCWNFSKVLCQFGGVCQKMLVVEDMTQLSACFRLDILGHITSCRATNVMFRQAIRRRMRKTFGATQMRWKNMSGETVVGWWWWWWVSMPKDAKKNRGVERYI